MRAPLRAGRAVARHCRTMLSKRELAVLASISRFRYMSAPQIEQLHFSCHATAITGARTCRRVLERLTSCGALWRLDRRIGGVRAGSASYVYALAPLGHRMLNDDEEGRVRRREPSVAFLDHTLAIAQLAVELSATARARDDIDVIALEPEPDCWRRFSVGLEGAQVLKPDLYVSLRSGDFDFHWFVEIDRSTHSAASVVRKCQLYQRYWQTGIEQEHIGLFPRVMVVTPGERRESQLARNITAARNLKQELFAVVRESEALPWLTGDAT